MKETEDIDNQVLQNLGILQSKINAVKDLTYFNEVSYRTFFVQF